MPPICWTCSSAGPRGLRTSLLQGLDNFLRLLASVGLQPRTLGATDDPSKSPLDEVIDLMRACRGTMVLGYPQITVGRGTCRETDCSGLCLQTEWNHIEAALAYSLGLPLLIIRHKGVSRGVFDRGAVSAFLYEVDLREPGWPIERSTNGALLKWKNDCLAAPVRTLNSDPAMNDRPLCPNCSTAGRPFYLRPIGEPFRTIAGGEWECSRCQYVR